MAAAIGLAATIAGPAPATVSLKADQVSAGAVPAFPLRRTVAAGVAVGVALRTCRIVTRDGEVVPDSAASRNARRPRPQAWRTDDGKVRPEPAAECGAGPRRPRPAAGSPPPRRTCRTGTRRARRCRCDPAAC